MAKWRAVKYSTYDISRAIPNTSGFCEGEPVRVTLKTRRLSTPGAYATLLDWIPAVALAANATDVIAPSWSSKLTVAPLRGVGSIHAIRLIDVALP